MEKMVIYINAAKLCNDLLGHNNYKVFFDNLFTTLDLLHHFSS